MSARYSRSWAGWSGLRANSAGPANRRRTARLRVVLAWDRSDDRAGRLVNIRLLVSEPVGDYVIGHLPDRTGVVFIDILDVDLDLQGIFDFQQQLQRGRRGQAEVSH